MRNYRDFNYTDENYLIFRTIEKYNRTDSGKSWRSKPFEITKKVVSAEHYTNYITSIPFFNNFGDGAYCRAQWSYNVNGYLPTTITTVSPGKTEKHIAKFFFISKSDLLKNAGWRETEIVNNAIKFEIEQLHDTTIITLYTKSDGVTACGQYDVKRKIWRG